MEVAAHAPADSLLDTILGARTRRYDHDLFNGWVGLGVYALARREAEGGRDRLVRLVERLAATARRDELGVTWFRTPDLLPDDSRPPFPRGHYNLGVSHGQAGVIGFLADVLAADPTLPGAAALLDDAVAWLLPRRRPGSGRAFPPMLDPDGIVRAGRRERWLYGDSGLESWAYGDLGHATALLAAGRVRRRPDWEAAALEVARVAAVRTSPGEVPWAGFCSGRAGIAYLLDRLHRASGEALFGEAAARWIRAAWMLHPMLEDDDLTYGRAGLGLATTALGTPGTQPWETAFAVGATALASRTRSAG